MRCGENGVDIFQTAHPPSIPCWKPKIMRATPLARSSSPAYEYVNLGYVPTMIESHGIRHLSRTANRQCIQNSSLHALTLLWSIINLVYKRPCIASLSSCSLQQSVPSITVPRYDLSSQLNGPTFLMFLIYSTEVLAPTNPLVFPKVTPT